jgi:hypothetical protein
MKKLITNFETKAKQAIKYHSVVLYTILLSGDSIRTISFSLKLNIESNKLECCVTEG